MKRPLLTTCCIAILTCSFAQHFSSAGKTQAGEEPPDPEKLLEPLVSEEAAKRYRKKLFEGRYGIPDHTEVASIIAEVHETKETPWITGTERFEVPEEFFEKMLNEFNDGDIARLAAFDLWEAGTLMIKTKDGYSRRICWYSGGKTPLVFSLNGVKCTGKPSYRDGHLLDGSATFRKLVEDASKASKKKSR